VEKPISHNVWEGRQLVKATSAHNRIVQMGVQSRSERGSPRRSSGRRANRSARSSMCAGSATNAAQASARWMAISPSRDHRLRSLVRSAEKLPLHRQKLHYDWHWVWNTGNGDLGNQGIHQMDMARRFTGEALIAPATFSVAAASLH